MSTNDDHIYASLSTLFPATRMWNTAFLTAVMHPLASVPAELHLPVARMLATLETRKNYPMLLRDVDIRNSRDVARLELDAKGTFTRSSLELQGAASRLTAHTAAVSDGIVRRLIVVEDSDNYGEVELHNISWTMSLRDVLVHAGYTADVPFGVSVVERPGVVHPLVIDTHNLIIGHCIHAYHSGDGEATIGQRWEIQMMTIEISYSENEFAEHLVATAKKRGSAGDEPDAKKRA